MDTSQNLNLNLALKTLQLIAQYIEEVAQEKNDLPLYDFSERLYRLAESISKDGEALGELYILTIALRKRGVALKSGAIGRYCQKLNELAEDISKYLGKLGR